MPRGKYYNTNGVGSKLKYSTNLAVSVITKVPNCWTGAHLRDCLNCKLYGNPAGPMPVVICERHNHGEDNEYYVQLRTSSDRDRILELNGSRIVSFGQIILPCIEPWYQVPSLASPSHQLNRYRDINDDIGDGRPSKRSKIPTSPIRNNDKNTSAPGSTNLARQEHEHGEIHSENRSAPTSATHNQCTLFLHKNPDQYTPESFQEYLNRHLKETRLAGSPDDAGGNPPILKCYESPTPTIYDGWVLETNTEKVADVIIHHVSGKLVLSGTRLYFQRHDTILRGGRIKSPPSPSPSPSKYSSSAKGTNGQQQLPKRSWKETCMVYMSKIPRRMSLQEVTSFVNAFMTKARLFDCDTIIDSRLVGNKHNTAIFLCISADAAQSIVDELNDVSLNKVKLKLRRHNTVHQQLQDALSNRSPPLSNNTSTLQTSLSPSSSNQTTRNTDSTSTSRFVSLSSRKNEFICLSKVILFLDEAIIDPRFGFKSTIVGAERYNSSHYRLETNTVESALKLLKLSGIVYDSTIELVLKKPEGENSNHPFSTTEDPSTTVGSISDTMKAKSKNLTKQLLKLLKENRDLKRQNEILARANSSGSHNKPIELEGSSDEAGELEGSSHEEAELEASHEENEKKSSSQKHEEEQKGEIKRKWELEKFEVELNQLEKEFVAVNDTCKILERQIKEGKKEVNDDYERRLHEIHESWREQNTQIQEQQKEIERLKNGLEHEAAEKERLNSQLQDEKKRYQDMIDALTRSTIVIQEEMAVRKSMALSIVGLRKAKKRAEKELKAYKSINAKVKTEDKYDF